MRKIFFPILVLFLFIVLSSISWASGDLWKDAGVEKIGPADSPQFTLKDINGKKFSLRDFKGSIVVLNFWATWCPPCEEEMPSIETLSKKFKGRGLTVVAINDYEPEKTVLKFLKKRQYGFTILIDEPGSTSEAFRASVLPTTFIIDRDGKSIGRAIGMRDWAGPEMIKLFEELVKKK